MLSIAGRSRAAWRPGRAHAIAITVFLAALGHVGAASAIHAQGLAGAAVRGVVTDDSGRRLEGVHITATHPATGVTRHAETSKLGIYRLDNLGVGTYRLVARRAGTPVGAVDSVVLHLGEERVVNLELPSTGTAVLAPVVVEGRDDTAVSATPAAGLLPSQIIRNLPLLNRDFVGLLATSAQAAGPGALWVGGQHARLNAIQVDGAIASDVFGVNVSAGAGAGGKPISLEALDEVRILVAPFDVRQGGFSGGLINAVTRSGSNTTRASLFSTVARSELVGSDTSGADVAAFDQVQVGGSLSGPIVRNRLHYFLAGEWQSRSAQTPYTPVSDTLSVVSEATAERIAATIREQFGFDPGSAIAPQQRQPNATGFLKLSWNPSARHAVELTGTATSASSDQLNRASTTSPVLDGWQLSNSGSTSRSATRGARLRAISTLGRFSHEALIGVRTTQDQLDSRSASPLFLIGADRAQNYVAAGSVKGAQETTTGQRVFEVTDNVSLRSGDHRLTVGTQNVFARVADTFFLGGWGLWTFGSVDSLERALPNYYEVAQSPAGRSRRPATVYSSALLSLYVQDEWLPHPRLQLSIGLRADLARFASPPRNEELAGISVFGNLNTARMPVTAPSISPRVAVTWLMTDDGETQLRAGVGRFTARTPLVWIGNAYQYTGLAQRTLICDANSGVPAPTADIDGLPTRCGSGNGIARPAIAIFDRAFRAQQATKLSVGMDREFGHGVRGSLDLLRTMTHHALFVSDQNLVPLGRNAEGRAMYGAPSQRATGARRLDTASVDALYRFSTVDGERSTAVTIGVQRQWSRQTSLRVGYQWSRTDDVMSLAGFNGMIFLRNNPIDGSLAQRNLRRSARDVPHTFVAVAVGQLTPSIIMSVFVRARSGTPYALTTTGDANGDGVQRNDLLYIPRDSADLSLQVPAHFAALDAWIERQPCVRAQRGRIMHRNSCRNPFVSTIDARLSQRLTVGRHRQAELSVDLFNAVNLLNRNWGLVRESTATEFLPTLNVVRADAPRNRVLYAVPTGRDGQPVLPPINRVTLDASRWRAQIGLRFDY